MSERDPRVTVQHMVDATRRAIELTSGLAREDLEEHDVNTLALTRLVEILGEAARRVPDSVREEHDTIPWREMTGTRDRLIHGYDQVDLDILWTIVSQRLPDLLPRLERLLRDLD